MKSKAAIFWFVVSLVLAALALGQRHALQRQKVIMEKLQLQAEKGASQGESARVRQLEREQLKLAGELRAAEFELNNTRLAYQAALQATNALAQHTGSATKAAGPGSSGTGEGAAAMGKMLANMMKDPEMRKAMEQQQRMGIDMIYGKLFKSLQLSPQQEAKLKDMLVAQQIENMSQAGALIDGGTEDRARKAQELAEKNKQNQEQIKELLGEEKYEQYQDYNQTLGERMMLDQFGRQAEITPEQSEQLLSIMREEKRNVQINRGEQPQDPVQDWQKVLGTGEAAERLFSQQEEVNTRVLERAGQVLTPEQLQKFAPILQSQLEMQKAGLKMARQMFGAENKGTSAPAPPQP